MYWASSRQPRIVVGPRSALGETRVQLAELNWLGPPLGAGESVLVAAKLRLGAAAGAGDALSEVAPVYGEAELVLDAPAGAVAPGQAAVLYDGERCWAAAGSAGATPSRIAARRWAPRRTPSLTVGGPSPICGAR